MNGGAAFYKHQAIDANGNPYPLAVMYHYVAGGTTTDKTVWTDEAKTTPAAQPLVADEKGLFSFYGDGDYRLRIFNAAEDTELDDFDPVRITKDSTGIWEGDWGSDYPAATASSIGHDFNKIVAGILRGKAINANGSSYTEYFQWSDSGILSFPDIIFGGPFVDVRFHGALVDGVTDDSSAVQAAATAAAGGILFFPSGTCLFKNITIPNNTRVTGCGWGSILKFDGTPSINDKLFVNTNPVNVMFDNVAFDGNSATETYYLLYFLRTSGSGDSGISIVACKFQGMGAGGTAFHGEASSGTLDGINISGCVFDTLDKPIYLDTCNDFNIADSRFVSMTNIPITLETCSYGSIDNVRAKSWLTTAEGILLSDSTYNSVINNNLDDDADYSIRETGTANYNNIRGNFVSGGHANDIVLVGAQTVCHSNVGSSVFQNGQIISSGATGIADYNYKLYSSEQTTSAGTSNGQLNDTSISFNNITAVNNPALAAWDLVHLYGLTKVQWSLLAVRSINTINQLQLGVTDQSDCSITIDADEFYDVYCNLFDSDIWETTPYATGSISTDTTASDVLGDIVSEKEFLKIVFKADSGVSTDADVYIDAWHDIVSGDAWKELDAIDTTGAGTVLGTGILYHDTTKADLTIKMINQDGAKGAKITTELYRLKRTVDE